MNGASRVSNMILFLQSAIVREWRIWRLFSFCPQICDLSVIFVIQRQSAYYACMAKNREELRGKLNAFATWKHWVCLAIPMFLHPDILAFVCQYQGFHILIAEACAHVPTGEDIGRVKLPRLLRKRLGEGLQISFVNGRDFPKDLSPYNLVIHCGACMFNRRYVLERIRTSQEQHVPITNYGMAIAFLTGILQQIDMDA